MIFAQMLPVWKRNRYQQYGKRTGKSGLLIAEIAGGELASDIIDIYPSPVERKHVSLAYTFLKIKWQKIIPGTVKYSRNLGFGITKMNRMLLK